MKVSGVLAMVALAATCSSPVSVPHELSWEQWTALTEGVSGGAAAVLGDTLVYVGGTTWRNGEKKFLKDTWRQTPGAQKWSTGVPLPEPLAYGAYIQSESALEIFGGVGPSEVSRQCWRLEQGMGQWTRCGVLPRGAAFAVASAMGSTVFLFGGCSNALDLETCQTSVLRRQGDQEWKHVSDLPGGPIVMSAIAETHGHIYLFGGCTPDHSGGMSNHASAYRYDPATNRWARLRDLPVAIRIASAITLDATRILIAGGYGKGEDDADAHFRSEAWIYNIETDTYETAKSLPYAISGLAMVRSGAGVVGIGGEDRMRGRSSRVVYGQFK